MTNLKNFIVQEAIDEQHAKRLLDYQDKFHKEASVELSERLTKAWKAQIAELSKKYKPFAGAVQSLNFRNPGKACVGIDLVDSPRKIHSARFHKVKEVSPSVNISLAYTEAQRKVIRSDLIEKSAEVMKRLIDDWTVAFKSEAPNGKITTLFKIIHHDDEVRLTFASEHGSSSTHRAVFVVSTEFGKEGTKLRDHDAVFLIDLL